MNECVAALAVQRLRCADDQLTGNSFRLLARSMGSMINECLLKRGERQMQTERREKRREGADGGKWDSLSTGPDMISCSQRASATGKSYAAVSFALSLRAHCAYAACNHPAIAR